MQTFLPLPNMVGSAAILDMKRLGKQRVETLQIMKALSDPTYGWQHHPATNMWRGHEDWLMAYQRAVCQTWTDRGGKGDTCLESTEVVYFKVMKQGPKPWWLGVPEFHQSHAANLVRKDPDYYGPRFPGIDPDLPYFWPSKETPR